jgi:hypothetical protein
MISVLKGCKQFVASSGSNAHNAVFLNDFSKLVVLNRSNHVHPTQTMINRLRNLDVTYVDSFTDILPVSWDCGPFLFGHTSHLISFLKSKKMRFDEKKLKKTTNTNIIKFISVWCERYDDPLFYKRFTESMISFAFKFIEVWKKIPIKMKPRKKKIDYIFFVKYDFEKRCTCYRFLCIKLKVKHRQYEEIGKI